MCSHHFNHTLKQRGSPLFKARHPLPNHTNGDILLPLDKSLPRLIRELIQRHTQASTVLDIWLILLVMEFRLDSWRQDLNDLDIGVAELLAHDHDEMVERGFGGAVVPTACDGDNGQAGRCKDQGGGHWLRLEERKEWLQKVDVGGIVCGQFGFDGV